MRLLLGVLAAPMVQSCTSTTPHENFKNIMKQDIGKKADDPTSDIYHYSKYVLNRRVLSNGNVEVKFHLMGNCYYFYEVEKKTNIIIGWRFEGSKKYCAIAP
jgi:hypothetical protein